MTTNTKVLLGIVGAAAAGAIIGMLVAPEKGSELRERIKTKAGDLVSDLAELIAAGKEKIGMATETVMDEAGDLRSEAEQKVNRFKQGLS